MLNDKKSILDKLFPPKEEDKRIENEAKRAKGFIRSYYNSPMFEERYKKAIKDDSITIRQEAIQGNLNPYKPFEDVKKDFSKRLDESTTHVIEGKYTQTPRNYIERFLKDKPNPVFGPIGSHMNYDSKKVFLYKNQFDWDTDLGGVAAHEYSHTAFENEYRNITFDNRELLKNKINPRFIFSDHDADIFERKADVDSLRYLLFKNNIYDARYEVFEQKHLDLAKKMLGNDFLLRRITLHYSDEDLIRIMNVVASRENNKNNNKV